MAKVKPYPIAPGAFPLVRGNFLIADTKHGAVAKKWPVKRGKATQGGALWQQQRFARAAVMAANPNDLDLQTAINSVKGTTYVPRDFLMMCAFGNAYNVRRPDGTYYLKASEVTANPQYTLDAVTDEVGAMLVRADYGWIGLSPGSAGYVLTMDEGQPTWLAPSGGGGTGGALTTVLRRTTDQVFSSAASHKITWQDAVIDELGVWDPANPTRLIMPAGIGRFRISCQMLSPSRSFNLSWQLATPDNTASSAFFGALHETGWMLDVSGTTQFNIAGQGPWAPDPMIDYIEMVMTPSTAAPWTFGAGSSITLEAVIIP